MPHSLRARLSGLRYKKIISDKDYVRLCKALDNEKILDNIKAEIEQNAYPIVHGVNNHEKGMTLYGILQVIDKYRGELDCRECKVEYDCYECEKYEESEISIPYLMHKEMDIPISEYHKAYDIAIDYLRSQGKVKG